MIRWHELDGECPICGRPYTRIGIIYDFSGPEIEIIFVIVHLNVFCHTSHLSYYYI